MCRKFFWVLWFELRDRIANDPRNSLNKVINVATNHELILEQEKAAEKGRFTSKTGLLAQNVPKSSTQWIVETPNNSNKWLWQWKCRNYGKEHPWRSTKPPKCFNCEHMRKDCTMPVKEQPNCNNPIQPNERTEC